MSPQRETVLIVEDNSEYLESLATALSRDYQIVRATNMKQAQAALNQGVSMVLLDIRLNNQDEDNKDGITLLQEIKKTRTEMPVVIMTAHGDIDIAVESMRLGAADFIQKGRIDIRKLRQVLERALENSLLKRRVADLQADLRRLEPWELVGNDSKIEQVRNFVDMVAQDGYANVLISGETGTGKEVVARAIHARGWRKDKPFVPVSLANFSKELIADELFGHVKGAFTDARDSRIGIFEKAQGGVLFLDEIGELPLDFQIKLLRVLETRSFARVGSTDEINVDIQVVCATNRNLKDAIKSGLFREDLYFRLATVQIELPALRDRRNDIPLLVDHFIYLFRQQGRNTAGISPTSLERLAQWPFPGNVRELQSVIAHAIMTSNFHHHAVIEVSDLPMEIQQSAPYSQSGQAPVISYAGINLDEELARLELTFMQQALIQTEGKKAEAWRLLGLNDRFALRRRIKRIADDYPQLLDNFPLVKKLYS